MANYTSTFMPPIPEVSDQHVSCAEGIQVTPDLILFFGGSTTTTITCDSLIRALGDFNNNNGVYGNTDVIGYNTQSGAWYRSPVSGTPPKYNLYRNYHLINGKVWHIATDGSYCFDLSTFTWSKVASFSLEGCYTRTVYSEKHKTIFVYNPTRGGCDDSIHRYLLTDNKLYKGNSFDPPNAYNVGATMMFTPNGMVSVFGQDETYSGYPLEWTSFELKYRRYSITAGTSPVKSSPIITLPVKLTYSTVLYKDRLRYVVSEKGIYNFSKSDQSVTTITEMTSIPHTKSRMATRVFNPTTNTIYIFGGQQVVTPTTATMDGLYVQTLKVV